jgi:Glyoxalase/Bleomycin resistance protein/Dioxygenase superfamily
MLGDLDVFHVGVVVENLEDSMKAIGDALSISWAPVQEGTQVIRTGAGEVRDEPIRFTYSSDGPPHVELIESGHDSVWETSAPGTLHHVGAFAEDIAIPPGSGMVLEFGGGRRETPKMFAYYLAPGGIRVELVDSRQRPQFEAWFKGADLAAGARAAGGSP